MNAVINGADRRIAVRTIAQKLSVCIIIGGVLLVFGKDISSTRRAVIVNSDDAGMCSSVNKGTMYALQSGYLKSTSIMVCCPGFDEFAEFAKANPQHDYGVHLTLTCDLRHPGWSSVSRAEIVPSLLDKEGFLHSSTSEVAQRAVLSDVETELRAQITKAIDAGIRITHLDHHMFVMYSRPDLLNLYVRLGVEYGMPIRFARSVPLDVLRDRNAAASADYTKLQERVVGAGLPLLDVIESENYSVPAQEKRAYFLTRLRSLPLGVTEIVIHCASPDDSQIEPPDAESRNADTSFFSSREFVEEISRLRIDLIDWHDFGARRR